ncbi:hypothetical protein LCGC14_2283970 [marine sediment metagenome]|uniref:Uncharacterized protein n=1 Tax=marine sediment metagenome TaxID=412755 RepID=A0A0F9CTP5_9ZZZZ
MNQKDYKVISEIIDKCYAPTTEAEQLKKNVAHKLANYFDRESMNGTVKEALAFNRQQFLKDCGVK